MLKMIEIQEIMEKTKNMREEDKIDYIFTIAYLEAMENVKPFKETNIAGKKNANN